MQQPHVELYEVQCVVEHVAVILHMLDDVNPMYLANARVNIKRPMSD